jgi:hypothetical protein
MSSTSCEHCSTSQSTGHSAIQRHLIQRHRLFNTSVCPWSQSSQVPPTERHAKSKQRHSRPAVFSGPVVGSGSRGFSIAVDGTLLSGTPDAGCHVHMLLGPGKSPTDPTCPACSCCVHILWLWVPVPAVWPDCCKQQQQQLRGKQPRTQTRRRWQLGNSSSHSSLYAGPCCCCGCCFGCCCCCSIVAGVRRSDAIVIVIFWAV